MNLDELSVAMKNTGFMVERRRWGNSRVQWSNDSRRLVIISHRTAKVQVVAKKIRPDVVNGGTDIIANKALLADICESWTSYSLGQYTVGLLLFKGCSSKERERYEELKNILDKLQKGCVES